MQQLEKLIDKWEKLYAQPNIGGDYKLCLGECLSDAKAAMVGKFYEPHTLTSPVHFKKYKPRNVDWKWVIDNDLPYVEWCMASRDAIHHFLNDLVNKGLHKN
jgi:hypothetical protein